MNGLSAPGIGEALVSKAVWSGICSQGLVFSYPSPMPFLPMGLIIEYIKIEHGMKYPNDCNENIANSKL